MQQDRPRDGVVAGQGEGGPIVTAVLAHIRADLCTYIDTVRVFGVDHDRTNFTLLRKAAIRNVLPILAAGLQSEKAEAGVSAIRCRPVCGTCVNGRFHGRLPNKFSLKLT